MHFTALIVELHLPGCTSLKEKRSRIKPLLAAVHREFNVSAAEIDRLDAHAHAVVAIVAVSNDGAHLRRWLGKIPHWIEKRRPDRSVTDSQLQEL
jgi:uncharacterized protein YlxP (DUF503 family)